MTILDVFKGDAFKMTSLTEVINKIPYAPSKLGEMGLFQTKGIPTLTVAIEEQDGKLSLIPSAARGSMPTTDSRPTRTLRDLRCVHLPQNDAVMADEVQGIRAFGEETAVETVAGLVNDKLAALRANHEVTHEYHRIGAIRGIVLDADGTTVLYNLFTEFGVSEVTVSFDFTPGAQDMKLKALEVERALESALGGVTYSGIEAVCGDQFFDSFISHETVKGAYERYQDNRFARDAAQRKGFEIFGINWWNYRGGIGSVDFIPTDTCRFVVRGVPGLFVANFAPADFVETVNTKGKPIYAKQEPMRFDKGIEIHTQSNPLMLCTRPKTLIKGTDDT